MKRRIKDGDFQFPSKEWSKVSSEAKILIVGMLETKPEKRLTINEFLNDEWIKVKVELCWFFFSFLNVSIKYIFRNTP